MSVLLYLQLSHVYSKGTADGDTCPSRAHQDKPLDL